MHVEEHGNPAGVPALVLHGGRGSGGSPVLRSFFDPAQYRIICPDQRGAGRSTPAGCIESNTLADLLADLRRLREHLAVERWLVVGGSWGATLALLHALDQPAAVAGLLLRNVFLARSADIHAFFNDPRPASDPRWQQLQRQARNAGCSTVDWLATIFATAAPQAQRDAALCWWQWEQRKSGAPSALAQEDAAVDALVQRYRIQSHYLKHACWLASPTLLERCARLPEVPTLIVQGMEDAVCPPGGALALQQVLGARATLHCVESAGHDPNHPAMAAAMRQALQRFAQRCSFGD